MKRFDEDDIILSCLSVSCFCLTSLYILLTENLFTFTKRFTQSAFLFVLVLYLLLFTF